MAAPAQPGDGGEAERSLPVPPPKASFNKRQSLPPGALKGLVPSKSRGVPVRGGRGSLPSVAPRGLPPIRRGHQRRGSAMPALSGPPSRPPPQAVGGAVGSNVPPLNARPLKMSHSSPAPAHGKPPPPAGRRPPRSLGGGSPVQHGQSAPVPPLKSSADTLSSAAAAQPPPPLVSPGRFDGLIASLSPRDSNAAASKPPPLATVSMSPGLVAPTTAAPEVPQRGESPRPSDPSSLPPPMFSSSKQSFSKPKPKGRLGHRRSISTGSHNTITKDTIANRPTPNMLKEQLTKIHQKQAEDIKAGKVPNAPVSTSPSTNLNIQDDSQKKSRERPGFISKSKTKLTSTTKKLKDSTVKRANSGASNIVRDRAATTVLKTSSAGMSARQKYTTVALQQVLLLMGLKDVEHMQVIALVNSFCDHEFIQSEFAPGELPVLQNIEDKTRAIREAESNTGKIVKAQAIVRGYLVRKQLRGVAGNERQRLLTFNRLCVNVMDMEKKYIANLQALVNQYLQPLRARMAQGKDILRIEEISMIFSNVEVILESHQQNKRRLSSILERWPFLSGIGKVFLQMGADLAAYGVYVGNFKTAQDTIKRLRSERGSKFNTWANEVQLAHPLAPDLLTLISLPVNHISRLEPLLEMLSRFCLVGSLEEKDLNNAYSMLHEANQFVAHSLLQSEATAEIINIQRRIIGYDKPLNLIKPDRTLIQEGAIVNPKRHIFLFNDLILLTKPSGKSKFTYKEMQILELVSFQDVQGDKNTFLIKTPKEVHRLQTRGIEEKEKWMAAFAALKRKNKTIGMDVATIVRREGLPEDGIPSIVTQTIALVEKSITTEGIFRISANQNEINSLVEIFDNCAPADRDLSRYSVHAICGILKLWLRSLPEPLLTFSLYDRLVSAEKEEQGVEFFRDALRELSPCVYNTFVYLVRFLFKVSTHSAVNKMNTTNLSIVFGPTLLRPETETIETTLNSPIVNGIVQRILDNYDEIFL